MDDLDFIEIRVNKKKGQLELFPYNGTLLHFEHVNYSPKYDEAYLDNLILKANETWKDVNPDEWLHEIRGDYEF
jgi:hypothetical protein